MPRNGPCLLDLINRCWVTANCAESRLKFPIVRHVYAESKPSYSFLCCIKGGVVQSRSVATPNKCQYQWHRTTPAGRLNKVFIASVSLHQKQKNVSLASHSDRRLGNIFVIVLMNHLVPTTTWFFLNVPRHINNLVRFVPRVYWLLLQKLCNHFYGWCAIR